MILAWIVACVFLSDVSLGNVLFRRDDSESQVNLTTIGETQEHDGSGHPFPFCQSHPRCGAKMKTILKLFSVPDFKALANSEFLDKICADDYLGDACTGTDVCKDMFFSKHPNPIVFLRNYFCDNRQVLESSMDCWEQQAVQKAVTHCRRTNNLASCNDYNSYRPCILDYLATHFAECGDVQVAFIRELIDVIINPTEEDCKAMEE
ncbi:uncharacterized protein LOC121376717 [Gigantopelta aegis]|uniref:uncharacterized protein LOC121376717 n=1 Tax=Gigantopelta aegis TaxID=1735272 RepID=UPI001B889A00|nr:uncharacterized protein LOC121376717 [Gigantopelta aegis]